MIHKPGDRVGAILGSDGRTIEFLGYGVYEGDFLPDSAGGPIAQMLRKAGRLNPRIRLDNGDVVWGCECWWGPEDLVKQNIEACKTKGLKIRELRIQPLRDAVARAAAAKNN